jgi:hypothetical protein
MLKLMILMLCIEPQFQALLCGLYQPASFKWSIASIPYAHQESSCSQEIREGVNENWYL